MGVSRRRRTDSRRRILLAWPAPSDEASWPRWSRTTRSSWRETDIRDRFADSRAVPDALDGGLSDALAVL